MTNLVQRRVWSWRICLGVATGALALVVVLGQVIVMTPSAEARSDTTFTVLYSFTGGTDGSTPQDLVRDAAGNLYGTTTFGGAANFGTVFKLDTTGAETLLFSFTGGADGGYSRAGLIRDAAGNLYGTTQAGGAAGFGTVFKLDTTGAETVLHSFTQGAEDGLYPFAGLVRDAAGNLYGTTWIGGLSNSGMVFKLDTTGAETVLHSLIGGGDGAYPYSRLVRDGAGDLYGTTYLGGNWDSGTVYKLDATGAETVLYSFKGTTDGQYPYAALVRDAAGNLYGTTYYGGDAGRGTVFKVDTTGVETVLHSFRGPPDGAGPVGDMIQDAAGSLYGTTEFGGSGHKGTLFKVDTTGKSTILHSFRGGATDGESPRAGLVRDAAGNLYGTTEYGGSPNSYCRTGCGTVFKLSR